jgi:5-hydroxyisourate hydrolase
MITTHVLDTARGRPAEGVHVTLSRDRGDGSFAELAVGVTDADGRQTDLTGPDRPLSRGAHRLVFATGEWFSAQRREAFYPQVAVTFDVVDADEHYHVPLLLSPFGYSTYRGT